MATSAGRKRVPLTLPLVVVDRGGIAHDFVFHADGDTPTSELIGAIREQLRSSEPIRELICARTRRPVDPSQPLFAAGLVRGDRLLLDASRAGTFGELPQADTALELVVVGGPASGRRFALVAGENVLGRDAELLLTIDDASLSSRHCAIDVRGERVVVRDLGSVNGTAVEGVLLEADGEREVGPAAVVRAGRTLFGIRPRAALASTGVPDAHGTIALNRKPRVVPPFDPPRVVLDRPPDEPQGMRLPMASALGPLVLGAVLWFFTRNVITLAVMGFTPVIGGLSWFGDRRHGKRAYRRHLESYRGNLRVVGAQLDAARAGEAAARRAAAPSLPDLLDRAKRRAPELWERRPTDRDFLRLRLGSKRLPSLIEVDLPVGGTDEIRRELAQLTAWYGEAPEVPFAFDLTDLGAVGVVGAAGDVNALGRALVVQAATLHSPADLHLAAAVADANVGDWEWLKWLPHSYGEDGGQLLARGSEGAEELLEVLLTTKEERLRTARAVEGAAHRWILFLLDEAAAPSPARVRRLLVGCAEASVAVLWLGRSVGRLPGECRAYVELDATTSRASFSDVRSGQTVDDVTPDELALDLAAAAGLALAPLDDASAESAAARLPTRIGLSELVAGTSVPEAIAERWERARNLGAPIGSVGDGEFVFDLRRDGPHGLVAGTTGAGKSEFLQTLVSSLALAHPPTRLNFLLVDYKGGLAFQECRHLPHTVGLVTDLDEHLAKRVLASLEAELKRRELVIKEQRAKDLLDLEARSPEIAPPALLIVIDEFATLVEDVPEFVDGIVDVAQRGRGVGVHLMLATQRPSGFISPNIRANTNFKVALRVTSPAESSDVIDAPDAATISKSVPGRAYVRTGHDELTMIQTAFVGAPADLGDEEKGVEIAPFTFGAGGAVGAEPERPRGGASELDVVVESARRAAELLQLEPPRSPWLPPLPTVLPLGKLEQPESRSAIALGLIDEPDRQLQRPFVFDIDSSGGLLVFGAGRSGKTTLLRTLAAAFAERVPVSELHVYGLDFGGGGLRNLEELPHCGAIVPGENEEQVERLFALLQQTLEERRQLFADADAYTVEDFRRKRPDVPLARLLVLLDGYAGFVAGYDRAVAGALPSVLLRLQSEGQPVGIHFVISADRRGAVQPALFSSVAARVVLRMNAEEDYIALNLDPRRTKEIALPPGQGFVGQTLVVQVASISADPSAEAQSSAIAELASRLAAVESDRPPVIGTLPSEVRRGELPAAAIPLTATLGLAGLDLQPLALDLRERHALVIGPNHSGRTTALRTIAEGVHASTPGVELHLLSPRPGELGELPFWASAARNLRECEGQVAALSSLLETASDRRPRVVIVDDAERLGDTALAAPLERLIREGRDCGVRVVAVCEKQSVRFGGGWAIELRKDRHGLLLQPETDVDGDVLGVQSLRRGRTAFPVGRGFLIMDGVARLVQVGA